MTNFHDAWFLLQHSAYPVASGVVFFLLGLWFAYLLWHRWVRHLHVLKRENQELEDQVQTLKRSRSTGELPSSPRDIQSRLRTFFGLAESPGLEGEDKRPRSSSPFSSSPVPRTPRVQSLIATAAAAFAARTKALDGKA